MHVVDDRHEKRHRAAHGNLHERKREAGHHLAQNRRPDNTGQHDESQLEYFHHASFRLGA